MVSIVVDNNTLLRSFSVDDGPELFEVIDRNRAHLHPWLNWVAATTKREHSLQFIERSIDEQRNQASLDLGIFLHNKIIGGVGMHGWNQDTKSAQVGYWISKENEGKGIIQACLRSFITFLFTKAGLNKIEIRFVPANTRSGKVAGKLGFRTEGIIRQSVINNGLLADLVVTGLLRNEWSPTDS